MANDDMPSEERAFLSAETTRQCFGGCIVQTLEEMLSAYRRLNNLHHHVCLPGAVGRELRLLDGLAYCLRLSQRNMLDSIFMLSVASCRATNDCRDSLLKHDAIRLLYSETDEESAKKESLDFAVGLF